MSPNQVAAGDAKAVTLEPDLLLGGPENGFGHLADVATLEDGTIFVLDRLAKTIRVFAADGESLGTIGREGSGPGEFRGPTVLAARDERIAVLDSDPVAPIRILDVDGTFVASLVGRQLPGADWGMQSRRATGRMLDWPFQAADEDWTRRLEFIEARTVGYMLQEDERLGSMIGDGVQLDSPPVHLVRFSTAGQIVDTVWSTHGPPARNYRSSPGEEPQFDQPVFAHRPVWGAGSGWVATGHGYAPQIDVVFLDDARRKTVVWPAGEEVLADSDKTNAALWLKRYGIRDRRDGDRIRREWERASRREKEDWIEFHKQLWLFPEAPPEVTAIYGAGDCLWLAGFSSADYPDGTALTLVIVNIVAGRLEGVIRVARGGSRVRHVDRRAIYTSFRNDMSVHYLERYPVPDLDC